MVHSSLPHINCRLGIYQNGDAENIHMWHLWVVSALDYLAMWYFQIAIHSSEKVCDVILYVTSCYRGLQFLWHPGYLVSAAVQNCNASLLALELWLCLTFRLIQMKQELAGFPASHSSLCSSSLICGLGEESKINHFINIQVQYSASSGRISNFNYNV